MRRRIVRRIAPAIAALAVLSLAFVGLTATGSDASATTRFDMVRSAAAVNVRLSSRCPCPRARGAA